MSTKPAAPVTNICPFSLQSHVVDMVQKSPIATAGGGLADPGVMVKTQQTFAPCGGPPCAVYDKKKGRCGLIAPTAEELAAALVAALREVGKA